MYKIFLFFPRQNKKAEVRKSGIERKPTFFIHIE